MNSLETEYSFLAPTWKLPSVATPSMYASMQDVPYSSISPKPGPDMSIAHNTMYNSRYVPPNSNRRTYPQPTNQKPGERSMQTGPPLSQSYQQSVDDPDYTFNINSNDQYDMPPQPHNNGYANQQIDNRGLNHPQPHHNGHANQQIDNRGLNHPQPVQKRVQIIDHNRQTPSTDYIPARDSRNSYNNNYTPDLNQTQPKPKLRHDHMDDNKSDSTFPSVQRPNNFKIHEYLYGLSAPDPGSYVNAYKNQRRRLEDEKVNRKSVLTNYKTFVQNGGFGPAFGNVDRHIYEQKLDTEKKRKSYSKVVRETNQYKVEEQKRAQNNGGQLRDRTYVAPMPKLRRPDAHRSHFLSAQETYGYADHIEKRHYLRPQSRLLRSPRLSIISPIFSTPLPTPQRLANSPLLRRASFDNLHPWNQSDILSGEVYVARLSRSSSLASCSPISTPATRRVRFHSRDFIRRRSSTFIDLPTEIIGTNVFRRPETASSRFRTRKSTAKILEEKDQLTLNNDKHLQSSTNHHSSSSSTSNIKEKKFITSHSMMNCETQSPPTAILKIINQPYNYENTLMATTSTSTAKKPILIIKSPENSSKTSSRNVRFGPENTTDDDQVPMPVQNSVTTQSTSIQIRKLPSSAATHSNP